MTKFGEDLIQSLNDALDHVKGQGGKAIVHEIELQEIDVAEIRAQTDMPQAEFAHIIGVSKRTLLNWEQGRSRPNGPAKVLLLLIANQPSLVQILMHQAARVNI